MTTGSQPAAAESRLHPSITMLSYELISLPSSSKRRKCNKWDCTQISLAWMKGQLDHRRNADKYMNICINEDCLLSELASYFHAMLDGFCFSQQCLVPRGGARCPPDNP